MSLKGHHNLQGEGHVTVGGNHTNTTAIGCASYYNVI